MSRLAITEKYVEMDGVRYSAESIGWDFVGGPMRARDVTNGVTTFCQGDDNYLTIKMRGVYAVDDCRYPDGWQHDTSFNAYGCHVVLHECDDGWGYSVSSPDSSHGMTSGMCLPKAEVIAFVDEIAKAWGKLYPKQENN